MMVKFRKQELKDIIISIAFISILFSVHMYYNFKFTLNDFIVVIPIALIVFALSLFAKIYTHKLTALKFKYTVTYNKWGYGLIFSLLTFIFSVMILTPGYMDYGAYARMADDKEKGIISLSGNITNIILSIIFLLLVLILKEFSIIFSNDAYGVLLLVSIMAFKINSFIAFFNLIPFYMLDGINVINWNRKVWIVSILISALLSYLAMSNIIL
ncbi:MAG: hypothetical protein BZ136_00180 [Methanosphaera sp. rholeuAM74]|nr:MAG: hypothetical protein BZ136_00180 [Methanosphaera sp. rholeuAM74]